MKNVSVCIIRNCYRDRISHMPYNILFVLSNIYLSSFSSFLLYYFASTVGFIFVHLVAKSLFGFSTIFNTRWASSFLPGLGDGSLFVSDFFFGSPG